MTLPVLMIPGLNCSASLFASFTPDLWQSGPVTVANHTKGDTIPEIAAAVLADAPPLFALGGFSLGGYVALEIMRQAPERVKKLALMDTTAKPDTPEGTAKRRDAMALARSGKFEAVLRAQFPGMVHKDHAEAVVLRERWLEMGRAVGPEAFVRHNEAIIGRIDSRPHLAAIKVPTLVVVGDGDQLTPPEAAEEMAAGIPGAKLTVIPNAGHLTPFENPDAFRAALNEWLAL